MPQDGDLELDLDGIKSHVYQSSSGTPATFDLMVVADAGHVRFFRKIPFSAIPATASIVLNEAWNHLQVDATKQLKSLEPFLRQDKAADS